MKVLFTSVLFLFIQFNIVAQSKTIAKVQKVNGIEVYVMAEPLRSYDVVIGKGNSLKWSSFLTGGLLNESVSTKITSFANKIKKKAKSEGIEIDAVIYTNGKKISAIKFNDELGSNDRLAEVQKLQGLPVFIMNEPIINYRPKTTEGPGLKWKSMLTVGLVNNSIEQDISKYSRKMTRDFRKGKVDALLYNSGKKCAGIKFE